jgi:hypothetical protein
VKYLPLFHHFKAIYQFPKHIIFLVKIVANASLNGTYSYYTFAEKYIKHKGNNRIKYIEVTDFNKEKWHLTKSLKNITRKL